MNNPASAQSDPVRKLLTRPIPKSLWHYTSYRAFQGIVESKKIFATDLRYLNDEQEFVHARRLVERLGEKVLDTSLAGAAVKEMLKNAVDLAFKSGPLNPDRLQIMVASFSEARDQLSQWRGYSGASSGVSLALNLEKVRPPLEIGTGIVFAPCVYDLNQQNVLLERALSHMTDVIVEWAQTFQSASKTTSMSSRRNRDKSELSQTNLEGPNLHYRVQEAMTRVNFDLVRLCPLLKNSAFSEEREWRLVLPISMDKQLENPRRYRFGSTTLIPYIEYPLCDSNEPIPLNDLILGPGSHAEAKAAVTGFLHANNLTVIPQSSKVPYRVSS